ncbi:MAG: hypothetical protein N3F66_04990 [Spirochaetes bacterium]|nr:hypothetical protein [Spirochaetota bacterium]
MKRIFIFIVICMMCFMLTGMANANDNSVYDDAKAIERDSKNAQKEAEKKNYDSAREEAGRGFDTPTDPLNSNREYDIPMPGEPQIDNE